MIQDTDYDHKTTDYYQQTQHEVLDFIPEGNHIVLDIGCGEGRTGLALKDNQRAKEVHGIELVPEPAEKARQCLDSVLVGNLETMTFPFQPKTFDYIIATDVLEHLIRPDQLLQKLQIYLKADGQIIASVPNMQHIRVIWHLAIEGDWHYQDSGPFDRTHMRFFTKTSFKRLFTDAGYSVHNMKPILLTKARPINTITLGLFERFLAFRYMFLASRVSRDIDES